MLLTPQSRRKPTPEDARHLDSIPETAEKLPRRALADDPSALRQPFFGAHPAVHPSYTRLSSLQVFPHQAQTSARQLPVSTACGSQSQTLSIPKCSQVLHSPGPSCADTCPSQT